MKALPAFVVSIALLCAICAYALFVAHPVLTGLPVTRENMGFALFVSAPMLVLFGWLFVAQAAMHRASCSR